jgi:hypothetical protein
LFAAVGLLPLVACAMLALFWGKRPEPVPAGEPFAKPGERGA